MRPLGILLLLAIVAGGGYAWWKYQEKPPEPAAKPEAARGAGKPFYPTQQQWASLTVEPIQRRVFRPEITTEGKITIDEDTSTPVFSPYAGRVIRLMVRPGDKIMRGQPLFTIEATDAVQAQNDYIAALSALNKSRSQLNLAQSVERRLRDLSEAKAISQREYQAAQADLVSAQNDVRSAETAREAVRNRLRILGRTDQEIDEFEKSGKMTSETTITSPLEGTVVQRKVGPGQYISAGSSDPLFVVGDLSRVWVLAYVRESEAANVKVGQAMYFKVLGSNELPRGANIAYIAASLDPATRRLTARAVVSNPEGRLRPEMFVSTTILTGEGDYYPAVPRDAVLYEGETARVWVVTPDNGVELRFIKPGLLNDRFLQVLDGVRVGERVIVKGSVFIDREGQGG
ncbi:efflux RND transporter periplasmic adaptor subunit [Variibacter gotjawalensis]|uniref:efflux RND transporter periplasmic adaptor subunit n=1 Tax=Variibacter gotjawalensis TaxID=1333996 RepID=UPI001D2AC797|nr:efflux RND transporter periplasmic adaptor subunit [Variibacter gotjawalensis]NIK45889.1 cobalt-zinc-cadmium efflux system membrane fusion protein [Variibacter gotjawalensis]